MYYKIVNEFDVDCLNHSITHGTLMNDIPAEIQEVVIGSIHSTVSIFDDYYGASRHPESDLGGFLIFLPTLDDSELFYTRILNQYNLKEDYSESIDIIAEFGNIKFIQQTYILSSDYGIVLVLPLDKS